jgi:hypothetical protein
LRVKRRESEDELKEKYNNAAIEEEIISPGLKKANSL